MVLTSEIPILEARDLEVRRGTIQVLGVPFFTLQPGSVTALIGPNGSGKSTLLQTLASLIEPATGEIVFHGKPLRTRLERQQYRQRVTLVFQESLLFDATVHANLASGLKLHHIPRLERERRVTEAAARFGIAHLLGRSARKLSGGEAQRTSLARAFALEPEILFLDEPFSALDPPTREALIDDLAVVLRETRTTAVLATHDQMEAMRLADVLAVMHRGRIAQTGSVAEVINHPSDEFVAAFVGMETILDGTVTACSQGVFTAKVAQTEVEAVGEEPLGAAVRLGVRPENVTLSLFQETCTSARNNFPGTITRIVPKGPYYKVELDCGFFLVAFVTGRSLEELKLRAGTKVVAGFKATAVHVVRA
jgi:tungstate transport system ATP-binding protein